MQPRRLWPSACAVVRRGTALHLSLSPTPLLRATAALYHLLPFRVCASSSDPARRLADAARSRREGATIPNPELFDTPESRKCSESQSGFATKARLQFFATRISRPSLQKREQRSQLCRKRSLTASRAVAQSPRVAPPAPNKTKSCMQVGHVKQKVKS
eukprot:4738346-Pleurochrysis_carterae.AAC.1